MIKKSDLHKIDWDNKSVLALRRYMGLTQCEMADKLGTRQQTVSEWETSMYKPRGASTKLLSIVAERAEFKYNTGSTV